MPDNLLDDFNASDALKDYLNLENSIDGLDKNNMIPDEYEPYLYPDIYAEYEDNDFIVKGQSIKELKSRYSAYKQSIGVELKILGFSFGMTAS